MTVSQDVAPSALASDGVVYSPYPDQDFPNRVFFGDTHLHTASCAHAGLVGAILTPDDACRSARGEVVTSNTGLKAKLARPLDFLVITDHSENLGLPTAMFNEDPVLTSIPCGQQTIKGRGNSDIDGMRARHEFRGESVFAGKDPLAETDFAKTLWEQATDAAERNNVPGAFTAMDNF